MVVGEEGGILLKKNLNTKIAAKERVFTAKS
jgi:hypothetical protein